MENNNTFYLKTDNNFIINEKRIRWVKKIGDSTGCNVKIGDTHKICKINNPDSYNKLNKHFE